MKTMPAFTRKTGLILMALLLSTIPITSSPWAAKLTARSTVSPLAMVPLGLLLIVWLLPALLGRGEVPSFIAPLFFFVAVAALSSALSLFYEIYPSLLHLPKERVVRGMITLIIGMGFYLVTTLFFDSEEELRKGLRWVYLGGVLTLLWASVQAYFVLRVGHFPREFQEIHRIFSIHDLPRDRVSGLAYEPSWLGDQLVILYLPLWMASVLRRTSVFGRGQRWISVELGLLIWGGAVFFLTKSRVSMLSLFVVIGFLVLVTGWKWAGGIGRWVLRKGQPSPSKIKITQGLVWIAMLAFFLLAVFGTLWFASRLDWRLESLFKLDHLADAFGSDTPFFSVAEQLAYAERVVYWDVGLRTFADYPVLGVGVGNVGLLFRKNTPAFGYRLVEMIRILTSVQKVPNAKSLWVRLLAETGGIGFLLFVTWLVILGIGAWRLGQRRKGVMGMLGIAASLALVAQIIEGFSLDTFALPHLWVMLGFVSAAVWIDGRRSPYRAARVDASSDSHS